MINKCKFCENIGFVFMREKEFPNNTCCMACICQLGCKEASLINEKGNYKWSIAQWNGQSEQLSNKRILVFDTPNRLKDIVYQRLNDNPVRSVIRDIKPNYMDTDND